MGRNTLRLITILGIFCIVGIAVVQIYWFRKAFDLHEKQFTHRTTIALNRVANQLLEQTMDSTARLESIRQLTTNYFTVEFNSAINAEYLETALFNEFHNQEIDLNFYYGIFECYTDSFIVGNYVDMKDVSEIKRVKYPRSSDDNFYFGVSFPQKQSYIASQMKIWIVFSVLLLSVIFFFGYALFVIFKQKRLSEIKTDFINNMTHELKTPLATISASSEVLMRSESDNPKVATYSAIINQESKRLKQQIESVLKISVLDSGTLTISKETIDLSELIDRVVRTFKPIIESQNGDFTVDLCEGPLPLNGDPNHLENVLHNLIENGIKYSAGPPAIRIGSTRKNNSVEVRIADQGIGIPVNMQKRIFEKFFRVPTGDVHDTKGFGLGLYYVHRIIRSHGGQISVSSSEGRGSEFTITLPLKKR